MSIILISGFKRSGKDTVAKYITENYGYSTYAFAQPIKDISYLMFGWKPEDDEELKEVVDPFWGFSRRQFWQYFGTDWAQYELPNRFPLFNERVGRTLWVKKFEKLYLDTKNNYVISDWRFPFEYEVLKKYKPLRIKVIRNGCNGDGHESESYINTMNYDYCIINDSTLEALHSKIEEVTFTL